MLAKFEPYRAILSVCAYDEKLGNEIQLSAVRAKWGKEKKGSSEKTRQEASATFASLLNMAGLADVSGGRKPTIRWKTDLKPYFSGDSTRHLSPKDAPASKEETHDGPTLLPPTSLRVDTRRQVPAPAGGNGGSSPSPGIPPISADMTNWDADKIRLWFAEYRAVLDRVYGVKDR